MRLLSLLVLSLFILLYPQLGFSQNCTTNLLPNPDFEIGLNNWTTTGAADLSTDAYSGNQAAAICDGSGSISKALPATPGAEYTASIWAKFSGNISYASIQLRFLTSSYSPIQGSTTNGNSISGTTSYANSSATGTAPANAAFVHFYIYKADGGCIFVDEAELCETEDNGSSNGIDLELSLSQSDASPDIYSSYSVTAILTNTGDQTATNPKVAFEKPDGVVYTGSNPYNSSDGAFTPNSNQHWFVDDIAPGASKTLTVNYFLLQDEAPVAYAQVIQATENDHDSSPNNGTPPIVNEDDEASTNQMTQPPNNGDACAFSKTYDNITGMELQREFTVTENMDGSFTGKVNDLAPDGNVYYNELEVDNEGTFQSLNFITSLPEGTEPYANGSFSHSPGNVSHSFFFRTNDLDGDLAWENEYTVAEAAGESNVTITDITKLTTGDFLILGFFQEISDSDDFFPFYIRIAEDGTEIWNTLSGNDFSYPPFNLSLKSEAQDEGFYIAGSSSQLYYFEKINSAGNYEWSSSDGGPYLALGNISESEDGNFIYWSVNGASNASVPNNNAFALLYKYNANGTSVWNKLIRRFDGDVDETKITALEDGGIAFSYESYYDGRNHFHYARLDSDGNILWTKENPNAIQIVSETSDGGLLFSGLTYDNYPFLLKTTSDGHLFPRCQELPASNEICIENIAFGAFHCSSLTANGDLSLSVQDGSSIYTNTIDADGNVLTAGELNDPLPFINEYRGYDGFGYRFLRVENGSLSSSISFNNDILDIYVPFTGFQSVASFDGGFVSVGFKDFNASTGMFSTVHLIKVAANGEVLLTKDLNELPDRHTSLPKISAREVAPGVLALIYINGTELENQPTLFVLDNQMEVTSTFNLEAATPLSSASLEPLACGDYKIVAESAGPCGPDCMSRSSYWGNFTNGQFTLNKVNMLIENAVNNTGSRVRTFDLIDPNGTTYAMVHSQDFTPNVYPINNTVTVIQIVGGTFFSQKQVEIPNAKDIVGIEKVNGELVVIQNNNDGGLSLGNVPCLEENTPTTPELELPCDVSYTLSGGNLVVSGLEAGHVIAKLFSPSWETLYSCFDDCDNPFSLTNLPAGTYHLSVNKYSASWQPECSFLEDIVITNSFNLQSQNEEQLFFDAQKEGRTVAINWATNTGERTAYFVVEHSKDGESFSELSILQNLSDTDMFMDYQTKDTQPILGYNYYRLRQVYKDGTFRYTGSKAVHFDQDLTEITVFPNPVMDLLHLNLQTYLGESAEVTIVNQLGAIIQSRTLENISMELDSFEVDALQAGLYFIVVKTKNQKTQTLRFVKVKS